MTKHTEVLSSRIDRPTTAKAGKPSPLVPRDPVYKYRYTSGPFQLPSNAGSVDWQLLNNDALPQQARVTIFQCPVGSAKIPAAPGPLTITVGPGETTHNANTYGEQTYEVVLECNSRLLFPLVTVWPVNAASSIPGTSITAGMFLRLMP